MNPRSPTALPPQYHFLEGAEEGEASLYTIPQPNPLLEMLRLAAVNATMAQLMHMPMQPVTLPNTPVITVQQTQVNPALFVANETNNVIGKNGKSKKKTKPGKNGQGSSTKLGIRSMTLRIAQIEHLFKLVTPSLQRVPPPFQTPNL